MAIDSQTSFRSGIRFNRQTRLHHKNGREIIRLKLNHFEEIQPHWIPILPMLHIVTHPQRIRSKTTLWNYPLHPRKRKV
jgi:hypothetical protein